MGKLAGIDYTAQSSRAKFSSSVLPLARERERDFEIRDSHFRLAPRCGEYSDFDANSRLASGRMIVSRERAANFATIRYGVVNDLRSASNAREH